MGRLNETRIQALLREGKPCVVAVGDGSGLSFRITESGASWQLRYRLGKKSHWLTVGRYPECGLKEAQKRATRERARIVEGVDPVAERRRSRLALKAAKTFLELWQDYEKRALPDLADSTQVDVRRFMKKDILPRIGHLRIEDIRGGEIVSLVEQIGKRSYPVARRAFTIVSVVFSHAQAKHLAQFNPCAGLKLRAILGKRKPIRETKSLSEESLRKLFQALPRMTRRNALAVRIVLACAVRKKEMRLARVEHLDLDKAVWTIPAENSKNGKEFVIPLAPQVVEWFREMVSLSQWGWLMPGVKKGQPISSSTLNAALRLIWPGIEHFTVHDLRRTARTHLGRLGVDIITAEKCLNHTLGGLVDVYDRGDYLEERRKALQIWADFLVRCESPAENVVTLRRAG